MSKLAFSLIELIVVVILIGIISFIVVRLPFSNKFSKSEILTLYKTLYPNGEVIVFKNKEILIRGKKDKINLDLKNPKVYIFNGEFFKQKEFGYLNNKKIIFKYEVKNGIGESFILKNKDVYYVFKPFSIKKFNSFKEAKNFFLLKSYQPNFGEYY